MKRTPISVFQKDDSSSSRAKANTGIGNILTWMSFFYNFTTRNAIYDDIEANVTVTCHIVGMGFSDSDLVWLHNGGITVIFNTFSIIFLRKNWPTGLQTLSSFGAKDQLVFDYSRCRTIEKRLLWIPRRWWKEENVQRRTASHFVYTARDASHSRCKFFVLSLS